MPRSSDICATLQQPRTMSDRSAPKLSTRAEESLSTQLVRDDDAARLLVRPPRRRDALDIQHNCFPEQTLDEVQDYLSWCIDQQAKGRMLRLVAEADGQVVANGQLTLLHDRGEIGSLAVGKPYRQRGIGTALVLSLVEHARERSLHTVEISASTAMPWIQAWYERLGFTFQRTHTFPGQEQVAILQLTLDDHEQETPCPPIQA